MQTLATRKDGRVEKLRAEIIVHHKGAEQARAAVLNVMELGLWHAWQCGIKLNELKSAIGHGDFTWYIENNLPFDRRTAQRYMKIDNDHPKLRAKATALSQTTPDPELLKQLSEDTVRKNAYAYVPPKAQLQHKGNIKFARLSNYVNVANEHAKILQRHKDGLQEIDFDQAREDLRALYSFCQWLYGDSDVRPW